MAPQARGFMILRKVKPGAGSHAMPVEDKTQIEDSEVVTL